MNFPCKHDTNSVGGGGWGGMCVILCFSVVIPEKEHFHSIPFLIITLKSSVLRQHRLTTCIATKSIISPGINAAQFYNQKFIIYIVFDSIFKP